MTWLNSQVIIYIFFFYFYFWTYYIGRSMGKCYVTSVIAFTSHDRSYDECGKIVHRLCSSCISSIQNPMGTLLSSSCQLGLGVGISYLGQSLTKAHSSTKTSLFKANYRQDPRIGFKGRKKEKYKGAERFIEKIKRIQKEAKAVLGKV